MPKGTHTGVLTPQMVATLDNNLATNGTAPIIQNVGGIQFAPGFNVGSNAHVHIGSVTSAGTNVATGISSNNNMVQVANTDGTLRTYQTGALQNLWNVNIPIKIGLQNLQSR